MFCQPCEAFQEQLSSGIAKEDILDDAAVSWTPHSGKLYGSVQDLDTSSKSGCVVCRNFWHTWTDYERSLVPEKSECWLAVTVDQKLPMLQASFRERDTGSIIQARMMAMYLKETTSETIKDVLTQGCVNSNDSTGSQASFQMARFWMKQCLSSHSSCPKPSTFLPTRVIDVGPPDGSHEPFLLEPAEQGESVPDDRRLYAALSHCWGPPPWYRTTADTIADRRRCIPMADLPTTFRDAVSVTRGMGLRYLWIDSLCIIQADAEDWTKEAVKMCDYYQNAHFTITSAHSPSSHGGLFQTRDGLREVPFQITIKTQSKARTFQFSPMSKRQRTFDMGDLPLYKRAWVLQEMILSPRAIIYDPDVVRWECITTYGSERDPVGGIVRHAASTRQVQKAIFDTHEGSGGMEALGNGKAMQSAQWQHLIDDYMGRGLTNQSDRLIAFAGVAEAMQKRSTDVYIAGLWKSVLPHGLTWHVRYDGEADPITASNLGLVVTPPPYRSAKPVAPTWSFASVDVMVKYRSGMQDRALCEVLDAVVDGPAHLQTGRITLRGDCRTGYLMHDVKSVAEEYKTLYNDTKLKYVEDYGLKQFLVRKDSTILLSDKPFSWRSIVQAITGTWYADEVVSPDTEVTFVALLQRPYLSGMPSGTRHQTVHTLALVPSADNPNEYRRVGYAAWDDCTWYGYDCCEYSASKKEVYGKLRRKWGRIKPPKLAAGGVTAEHPAERHTVQHELMPPLAAYHKDVNVARREISII